MSASLKYLIAGSIFLVLVGSASINAAPQGFLEGHLKILSGRPVELADENAATAMAENPAEYPLYPLIILSRGDKKEITRVTADGNGNYRVALPPGDYILDVQRRKPGHIRARAQPFTIVSNQTVRVDMTIDTDHSRE
jgi:hypothetical protein